MEELQWPSVVLGLEVRAGWAEDDHEKDGRSLLMIWFVNIQKI